MSATNRVLTASRLVAIALMSLQICGAVFALGQNNHPALDRGVEASLIGQTGTDRESAGAAAKSGKADGLGNPELGGERRPLYRLNRSDVLMVSFSLSPEFDQTVTIQPDGFVTLKDVRPVLARGLTLDEFQYAVKSAYRGYLHDPQVAVALKEFEHPYFVAGGEVARPGRYELRGELSLAEAVQIAGGFTHEAKHSKVVLFRRLDDNLVEARLFNLKRMLNERNLGEAPELRPGDLVFVPQNSISKISHFLTKPAFDMYVSPTQF